MIGEHVGLQPKPTFGALPGGIQKNRHTLVYRLLDSLMIPTGGNLRCLRHGFACRWASAAAFRLR